MMSEPGQSRLLLGNRYRVEKTLGSGGMAMVYKAHDLLLDRPVAVKVLRQDYSADAAFCDRFRQEARAAASLTHPNIVTIHDFGMDQGRLYIIMEYVPGQDLKTHIKQKKNFSVQEALSIIIQACAGVGFAHRSGIVHCDIKPHNLIITPDNRLKVADFGIARALSSIHPEERSSIVWGSPQYFSPEQAAGFPPSPASDVYSMGVILYEMLTGKLPFESEDSSELARMHRENPAPSPARINPSIPSTLDQVILKVLSKEPSSRYRTCDQLGRVLSSYLQAGTRSQPTPALENTPAATRPSLSTQTRPSAVAASPSTEKEENPSPLADFDWQSIGLGLLAFVAVGGLIPFWLYIWLSVFKP